MNRPRVLLPALISLTILSSGCQEQSIDVNPTDDEIAATVDTTVLATVPQKPIRNVIYRDFKLESSLRNGYQFGMTVTEWNKHLAKIASVGIGKELSKVTYLGGPGTDLQLGSYRLFLPVDESENIQRSREGFYISGLFATPKNTDETNEVFRINGQVTDEPVLIGIQLDCNIPNYRINGVIQAMVEKDELQLLAGGRLPSTTDEPLEADDFRDVFVEGFGKMNREAGKVNDDETRAEMGSTSRTLLQCPRFYSILELTETRRAEVIRDSEYRVRSINNAYRSYHLVQKIYSKTQSSLDIEKYMTPDELQNYQNARETRDLIEAAN